MREIGELTARGTTRVPATLINVLITSSSPTAKPTHVTTMGAFKPSTPARRHRSRD